MVSLFYMKPPVLHGTDGTITDASYQNIKYEYQWRITNLQGAFDSDSAALICEITLYCKW